MERSKHEDRLSAYFDGELSLNERSEMEDLLRASSEMRRTLDDFQRQRQWLSELVAPELSDDFAGRVMDRVLALTPPPPPGSVIPVAPNSVSAKLNAPKRRSQATVIALALTTVASIAAVVFLANRFQNAPPGGAPEIAQNDPHNGAENSASSEKGDSPKNNSSAVAANGEKKNAAEATEGVTPAAIPTVEKSTQSIARAMPKGSNGSSGGAASKESVASESSNNSSLVAGGPRNPKATMTERPKAYRVQIGSRSEFDARLKEAGVAVYHTKTISPPTSDTRPIRGDALPDPEYVLVEGSEAQLRELVAKLATQADLSLTELKSDLEAEMLLAALGNADSEGKTLLPAEAKDGEIAAFTYPPEALRTILPPSLPPASSGTPASASKGPPPVLIKPREGELRYVPRVLFILDVRVGELEEKKK